MSNGATIQYTINNLAKNSISYIGVVICWWYQVCVYHVNCSLSFIIRFFFSIFLSILVIIINNYTIRYQKNLVLYSQIVTVQFIPPQSQYSLTPPPSNNVRATNRYQLAFSFLYFFLFLPFFTYNTNNF